MDEVDGMSAGDRGGVGALNALIKKSKVSPDVLGPLLTPLILPLGSNHLYCQRFSVSKAQAASVNDREDRFPTVWNEITLFTLRC
jgi:hypothetical protein